MSILILLGVLLVGLGFGWFQRDRATVVGANRHAVRVSLWLLLAVMGAKLGEHRALFAKDLGVFFVAIASSALLLVVFCAVFALAGRLMRRKAPSCLEATPSEEEGGAHELSAVLLNAGCIMGGFLLYIALPSTVAARLPLGELSDWMLRALLLCIGIDLGVELHRLDLRKLPPVLLLVPFVNMALSLATGLLLSLFTRLSPKEGLLLTAGLGWYSLSSVLLAERGMVLLSILAFIHNVFRELLAILSAPLAARVSPYLPVYLGGATSMDVMLPFVQRFCGREYTLVSFYSGVICSLAVIPLVKLIAG